MDTAKEVVEDFKLLVSGVSEERLPDDVTLIRLYTSGLKVTLLHLLT